MFCNGPGVLLKGQNMTKVKDEDFICGKKLFVLRKFHAKILMPCPSATFLLIFVLKEEKLKEQRLCFRTDLDSSFIQNTQTSRSLLLICTNKYQPAKVKQSEKKIKVIF